MDENLRRSIKPAVWGAAGGIVVAAIVAFSAGWIVTTSSAEEMAAERTDKAVIAALTPICVAQFKQQTQNVRTTQLAALEETDSWKRGDFVEKQGWATMPGSQEPNDEIADACADQLMEVAQK